MRSRGIVEIVACSTLLVVFGATSLGMAADGQQRAFSKGSGSQNPRGAPRGGGDSIHSGLPPCDDLGVCNLQVGITGPIEQSCPGSEGQWVSLAFPVQTDGAAISAINMTHNTNQDGGHLYLMEDCDGNPDTGAILYSGCDAIVAGSVGPQVYAVDPPVTTNAVTWVVAVFRSSFSFDVAFTDDGSGGTNFGLSYGNLSGSGACGEWLDLAEFAFGYCYCVSVEIQPQIGACCLTDGSCMELDESDCEAKEGIHSGSGTTCPVDPELPGSLDMPDDITLACTTPFEWLPKLEDWSLDLDRNYVEDAIDLMDPTDAIDVLLDLNQCPTQEMLDDFATLGTMGYVAKYIPVVELTDVSVADAITLGLDNRVAMVELNHAIGTALDVSTKAIKVYPSTTYSPNTVVEGPCPVDGTGVNIAILDTGVDDGVHESLPASKFVGGYNVFTHLTGNPDDDHSHGTHVAGIALGTGGASGTYKGVAKGAGLVDVKVWDSGGCGTVAGAIEGFEACITYRSLWNLRVVNMSGGFPIGISICGQPAYGTPGDGQDALSQAVNRVVDSGIVAVIAAGNEDSGANKIRTPGVADDAITVAAADDMGTVSRIDDMITSYSSRGPRVSDGDGINDEEKPDIAAPGDDITSASYNSTSGYVSFSGTSMAAPHVAGLAALILEAQPAMTPLAVKQLIIDTAEDYTPSNMWDADWGHGQIDAFSAANQVCTCLPTDLIFEEACDFVGGPWGGIRQVWESNSVKPTNPMVDEGVSNPITATVFNAGPNPASNFTVRLSVFNFSNGDGKYDICSIFVAGPVLPSSSVILYCPWTPMVSGGAIGTVHACLKAEIIYDCDTNYANNCAQHNINIENTFSPARTTFEVANPTDEDLDIRIEHDLDPCLTPNWSLELSENAFPLGGFECPRIVEATLTPADGTTGSQLVRFFVIGTRADGMDLDLGGVTMIGQTAVFPDCNDNGVDDSSDIYTGASQDLDGDGIPDECEGCEGDANGDGTVDPLDSGYVLSRFGCSVGTGDADCDAADVNGDGVVDPLDSGFVLARFGTCEPPPPQEMEITDFSPKEGGPGDVIQIFGKGFPTDPDDLCCVVPGLDTQTGVGMRIIKATPTELTAIVEAVPPDAAPGPIKLLVGVGGYEDTEPLFPAFYDVPEDVWTWARDPADGAMAMAADLFIPIPLQEQVAGCFNSGGPNANGDLVVTIMGRCDAGTNLCIWPRAHHYGTDPILDPYVGYDCYIPSLLMNLSVDENLCGTFICAEVINTYLSHKDSLGNPDPLDVDCNVVTGPGGTTLTLSLNDASSNDLVIDWGYFNVCVAPNCP